MKIVKNINLKKPLMNMYEKEATNRQCSKVNHFINIKRFVNSIIKDEKTIAIFLDIASSGDTKTYDQLKEDLGFEENVIKECIMKLKENNLVVPNPNPKSNKYRLSFNGKLFFAQLKVMFPSICS